MSLTSMSNAKRGEISLSSLFAVRTGISEPSGNVLSQASESKCSCGVVRDFVQCVGGIVVPGMLLSAPAAGDASAWSLGSGVVYVPSRNADPDSAVYMLVRKLGILCHSLVAAEETVGTRTNRVWVETLPLVAAGMGIAVPSLASAPQAFHAAHFCVGDRVLGVVKKKAGEIFYLDIGCPALASLNVLAFEGASKKNRPDIRLRDVIYAAISQADPDLEIELTCMDEAGKAAGMGILGRHEPGSVGNAGGMNGGVMISCSLELARRLTDTTNFPLIEKLGGRLPFEICVGCNGRIWLTARSPKETMLLANAIALADYVVPEVCLQFVEDLC
ncbi:Exosome complex component RRP40 [Taenia crassiceps]|uniref:Ribosomal RNA-processing protein 40 n=1 Tax=Taenia crassiceps TaxID=6207 RepID=A0ABR4QCJ7_9CEST